MSLFKCKMCGGDLEIADGVAIAECDYCGTRQTVPRVMDENMQNLFNRANTLRIKSEFDKAEKLYERIIQADTTQSEAYWGLILCKYGIEYVDDPVTFKKIPTCHRASYESIIADDDFRSALENADISQRAIYEEQAREIDRIQKEILALAQKEENYDVFICYKETDADGRRTQDSVIANDVYYQLTQEGFKVFYAAITLEGKLGAAYEPIIFAALHSAKVMLSIGTRPEYFNAVWVKNEWSRYLKIIKKDRSKLLIPCYRDMDAYELPEEFAHLQAQDMSKIGFVNDLIRGIKKVIAKELPKPATVIKETVVEAPGLGVNITPLLKRAFMFLEDGEWARADEFCEQVLNQDPENAQAYIGKLMAEVCVRKQEDLKDLAKPFDNSYNYQKVLRFADDNLRAVLAGYVDHINTRNENERLENIYVRVKSSLSNAKTERAFIEAAHILESILEYKDSAELVQICYRNAEGARKDAIYNEAIANMNSAPMFNAYSIIGYERAIKGFSAIIGWRDAEEKINLCMQLIDETKAKANEARLEKERSMELARKEAQLRARRNKRIATIIISALCALIAFIILLNAVIIPASERRALVAKYGEELVAEFEALEVGDTYKFGKYEQDNVLSNGTEDIEWIVLEKEGNKIFVVSKYVLDSKKYHTKDTSATWATSSLRDWLNGDFFESAFSESEKALIPNVTVSADKNSFHSTSQGTATQDKVFLLSEAEVKEYLVIGSRETKATTYAISQGVDISNKYISPWWLRTMGYWSSHVEIVNENGYLNQFGNSFADSSIGVRPAMWIQLSE